MYVDIELIILYKSNSLLIYESYLVQNETGRYSLCDDQ